MNRRTFFITGAAFAGALAAPRGASASEARQAVPTVGSPESGYADPTQGPWRRLFLDATVIEEMQGLTRVFHSAEKRTDNPVIRRDLPWETDPKTFGPYVYGTVMDEGGRLRLWYQVIADGNHVAYAESTDGITWTKPELGLINFRGSRKNNLVVSAADRTATGGSCHNPSVLHCPWASDPARRFRLYGYDHGTGPRMAVSPDGLRWRFASETEGTPLFPSSDVVNFFRDGIRGRFGATWKSVNRRGRAVGVAWSEDGDRWTRPIAGPVFVADDLDPDATQIYGMPVFPYQGLYIGLPWIYHARYIKRGFYSPNALYAAQERSPRTVDIQLAWSWDLINWSRPPDRRPWIELGEAGAFDSGMIYTARAPVVVGDRLHFYYGGFRAPHDEPGAEGGIGLATLRLDGFCSLHADEAEGSATSRVERFTAPSLTLNGAVRAGGYIEAELINRRGRPIPGFNRTVCTRFEGDEVRGRLGWPSSKLPDSAVREGVRVRFYLKRADLYAYLPDGAEDIQIGPPPVEPAP